MSKTLIDRVTWRRLGRGGRYVGTLAADHGVVRLSGHDAASGVEVTLSIPVAEIEGAHVSLNAEESIAGEDAVVLELAGSRAIVLRELGRAPRDVYPLARRLAALAAC